MVSLCGVYMPGGNHLRKHKHKFVTYHFNDSPYMRYSLKLNINWELLIDLHQLQKDKLDINTNVKLYNLLVMNLLRSKMFVSNELSKEFQIKSAEIKNVILTEKIPLFQQEKFRTKLKWN